MKYLPALLISIFLITACSSLSRVEKVEAHRDREAWNRIERFFKVPGEYADSFGSYQNLLFDSYGRDVTSAEEWKLKRDTLKSWWLSKMGVWPEIIRGNKMKRLDSIAFDGFTCYTVEFLWLPGEMTHGYLLEPTGAFNSPAVITVYYEPETAVGIGDKPYRDFALQLAKRGFVTLSLGTTRTTLDKTYSLFYPSIDSVSMQPLNALAYAAANAFESLAMEESVDSSRIGIMGHSYGGKWAMFASCLYEKFACAAWGDPGIVFDETKGLNVNYWAPWYLGYYCPPWDDAWNRDGYRHARGVYNELKSCHDLHELHAMMAPRPFFVSGGEADDVSRWKALNHTVRLNHVLGYNDRVGMSNRVGHEPTAESNEEIYDFFRAFL